MAPAPGELLFFDTFSHEMVELNLDLVQFPRPVFVEEVRVIPLGARVEANFPGGVRLGATNPTQFKLECFVNNLRNPGAATFETVGTLNFKHDHEIHLHMEKVIPTDGLVLRGMYNAITLAVYGTLSNSTAEQFALEAANAAAAASAAALAAEAAAAAAVAALPVVDSGTDESRSIVLMNGKGGRRSSRSPTSSSDNGLGIKIQDSPSSKYSTPPPTQDNRHSPVSSSHPERVVPIPKDDILDNVSDISDGDIPDLNDDEPMEPADEPEKTSAETTAPLVTDTLAKPTPDEDTSGAVVPDDEFMEAISDDEAEWSDEDMTDYDFGDWEDPVKIHDCFSVELFDNYVCAPSIADSELDSLSLKVSELGDMVLDQKWIDHVDSLVLALEPWKHRVDLPQELSDKVCVIALDCVSLDKAQSHSLPAATIRHLKSGLKFVKKLFSLSSQCVQVLVEERHIHEHLRTILSSGNVSTSIKYRALDLMDTTLDWTIREPQRTSLYEFCLSQCESSSLRLKPVYVRLLKRYNLKESLQKLRILTTAMMSNGDDAPSGDEGVSDLLQTIWKFFGELFLHRAQEQIQTVGYPGSNEDPPLDQMQLCCQSEQFLQCLIVLLSDPASSNLVLDFCFQILDQFVNSLPGLYYLSNEKQAVRQLTKLLLGGESVNEGGVGSDELGRSEESQISLLGQNIAFGTYGLQQSLKLVSNRDPRDILETIQNLHALTFSNEGQLALVKVLCLQEDLQYVLVNLVRLQESEEDVEQGAIKGYAMDLLIVLFRYSDDIGSMRGITNNIDWISDEDWISEENYVNEIRTELSLWLKATKLALGSDFSALALSIEKNLENTNPIAIDLIQAVRALSMSAKQSSPEGDVKREENLLQMFNSGVCDHFLTILGNINSHHQQPDLQTATFLGPSGFLLVSLINNIMVILREILNIRIASHGSGFKDTSLLTPLMRIYALLSVVPERALCKHLAVKASRFVIETLGICTANLEDGENSSVGTSIWTTLLKDLFSFSIESANAYLPGLDILSHLLPCSFPVALGRQALPQDSGDQDRLNNAKKIWSVHLLLAESDFMAWAKHVMMCYQMVSNKLTEVLAQLIDLSPAIVQLLTAAYIELVLELVEDREWSVLAVVMALGARLSALVKFKVTLSRLFLEDKGKTLLERLKDLTLSKTLNLAVLTQYVEMIQNLCDEKYGFHPLPNETRDDMLASLQASLPPQSVLLEFILYLWHLMSNETHVELHVPALNTLRVICRHDFGFALVQHCLTKILITPCLSVVKSVSGPGDLAKSKMNTLLAFLDLVTTLPTEGTVPLPAYKRTKHFKDVHLRKLFGGSSEEASDAIQKVKNALTLDDKQDLKDSSNDVTELLKRLDELDHSVKSWGDGSDLNGEIDNPIANLEASFPTLSELFANAKKLSLEETILPMNPNGKALSTSSVVETLDLIEVTEVALCKEFDLTEELKKVCYEKSLATNTDTKVVKKSEIERKALHNKSLISNFKTGGQISIRGRVYNRLGSRPDGFRSRPANTSRPPSLHVDDFLVLQQRGQQPTGPTGYNKQSLLAAKELFAEREAQHAKSSVPGFREATKEPVYDGGRPGGAGGGGGSGGVGRRGGGNGGRPNGPNGPGGRGPRPSRGWSPGEGGDRRQGRRGGGNWSGDRRSSLKERRKLGGRDDRNKIPPRSMNR